jgi:hypothetical protein
MMQLSFVCLILFAESCKNYKLIVIKCSDIFMLLLYLEIFQVG